MTIKKKNELKHRPSAPTQNTLSIAKNEFLTGVSNRYMRYYFGIVISECKN